MCTPPAKGQKCQGNIAMQLRKSRLHNGSMRVVVSDESRASFVNGYASAAQAEVPHILACHIAPGELRS